VATIDHIPLGYASTILGGGRIKTDDIIDHSVGIVVNVKVGDEVTLNDPLVELHYNDENRLHRALNYLTNTITISPEHVTRSPLIKQVIENV